MKEKKINKLANLIVKSIRTEDSMIKQEYTGDWCEYDASVSEKFKKMVMDLIEYKNTINISISTSSINISVDSLKNISSNPNSSGPTSKLSSGSDNLDLSINKKGFKINHGYRNMSSYNDDKIFDELYPIISERVKQINADNFNVIWEKIIKESKIIRNNNLDQILDTLD